MGVSLSEFTWECDSIIANLPSFNFEGEEHAGCTAQVAGSAPLYRIPQHAERHVLSHGRRV